MGCWAQIWLGSRLRSVPTTLTLARLAAGFGRHVFSSCTSSLLSSLRRFGSLQICPCLAVVGGLLLPEGPPPTSPSSALVRFLHQPPSGPDALRAGEVPFPPFPAPEPLFLPSHVLLLVLLLGSIAKALQPTTASAGAAPPTTAFTNSVPR